MLEKAIGIAISAHKNQTDRGGQPYIMHLIRVMNKGKNEEEKICGVLHDLIEDTNWSFEDLRKEGFSEKIVSALQCVTKKEKEQYAEFINRISKNPLAIAVKLNDLEDNMDITRLHSLKQKDFDRLNKYLKSYLFLKSI